MPTKTLETLHFDNLVLRTLPLDPVTENYVRTVRGACFSRVQPTPVDSPETVAYSTSAMALLDLPEDELQRRDFPIYLSGNKLLPGSVTASHCYCGHQFGVFSGQLGDGAAIYLGEIINSRGERWELQLKGAGKTPYSRSADGRKVLRSSIREFLCSEALHNLGIPTTRAGSCVTSNSTVVRDVFYDGHPKMEKATIVSRIAPTFIRFGSFEIFKTTDPSSGRHGPSVGQMDILKKLLNYTISTFYPEINNQYSMDTLAKYKAFYKAVVLRTARLVAHWQCVGFCHGVLNTDNMSIVGLTIDYGPFGFMDRYNPDHICNSSDDGARYTYKKQPEMCLWNLIKLGEALQPFLPLDQSVPELNLYKAEYEKCYLQQMRKKFGLNSEMADDSNLIERFLDTMEATGSDFTNSFRCLSQLKLPGSNQFNESLEIVRQQLYSASSSLEEQKQAFFANTMHDSQFNFLLLLQNTQPQLLEEMGKGKDLIQREMRRREMLLKLRKMTPEEKMSYDQEKWNSWLELYIERLKHDVHGSEDIEKENENREKKMNQANPKFVLRNYIAQNAITQAEKGDYSEVRRVLKILESPYEENTFPSQHEHRHPTCSHHSRSHYSFDYASKPPSWANTLRVT